MKTRWSKFSDERGAALVAALLMLVLVTALGMMAIATSSTESMIAENHYKSYEALYIADAGIQQAMAMLDSGDIDPPGPGAGFDTWSSVIPETTIGSLSYRVVVRYKLEDSFHNDGDGIGDGTGTNDELVLYNRWEDNTHGHDGIFNYPSSPIRVANKGQPVLEVTSTGRVVSDIRPASMTIISDVTENTLNIEPPGGMFSRGCLNLNGNNTIAGTGKPGVVTNLTAAEQAACAGGFSGPSWDTVTGSTKLESAAADPIPSADDFLGFPLADIQQFVTYDQPALEPPPNWRFDESTIGSYPDDPKIVYVDTTKGGTQAMETFRSSGLTGAGVLVVNGNLDLTGGFDWDGLVLCTGDLTTSGGAGNEVNINGGLMSFGNANVANGGVVINYDQAIIDTVTTAGFRYTVLTWSPQLNN